MGKVIENVRFMGKGLEIEEKEKDYILKKLATLDRIVDEAVQTEVEVDADKKGFIRVEVMVKTPRQLFRAEETTESLEASIDLVVDELQKQVVDTKDKVRTLRERGARSIKKKAVLDENARF